MESVGELDWRSQRVLITGGGGVVGTALVEQITQINPLALYAPRRADCDFLDQAAVFKAFADFAPTVVFHLAGRVSGIQGNLSFAGRAYYENTLINLNVVEASRLAGAAKVVAAGTTAIYSDSIPLPMREEDIGKGPPHGSEGPYAQAKLGLLAHLESYKTQYNLPFAYLVLTNIYGPNDRFDEEFGHVVPSLISRFHRLVEENAPTVTVWGDGTPTRDFLFSSDIASALIRCAEAGEGVFNAATGQSMPIRALVDAIVEVSRYAGEVIWDTSKPKGQLVRSYDVQRLRALGWTPQIDLRNGIAKTYTWFSENHGKVRR